MTKGYIEFYILVYIDVVSQVCVVKETHPLTVDASHSGYSQSSPSKYMEVGM